MKAIIKYFVYALFISFQFTAVNGENPLVGEYSANQKFAEIKIEKSLTGEYVLFTKDSKDADWKKISELRPANDEELHQTFGDRWNRVETSLVLQDGLIPRFGFYHIRAGQFGRDLILKPTCLLFTQNKGLMEIKKFNPDEAAAVEEAEKNQSNLELQKVEALKTAKLLELPPYGELFWRISKLHETAETNESLQTIQDAVVEWFVFVSDITKDERGYKITTLNGDSITPTIHLIANDERERAVIEALTRGTKIKVRGHLVIPERPSSENVILYPAILVSEPGIAKSEEWICELLKDVPATNLRSLKKLQSELARSGLTKLQRSKLEEEYGGKVVDGFILPSSHEMANNAFSGYESPDPNQGIEGSLDVVITCQNDTEYSWLGKYKSEGNKPIRFRGVVNGFREKDIRIWPAILIPEAANTDAPRKSDTSNSGAIAKDPRIADGEVFVTSITKNDIYNSNGIRITDPVLILMQDRANVHRFGNPDGDYVDQFFKEADHRAKIRSYMERGSFPQDVKNSILAGKGDKFRVKIYKNSDGKDCVDVGFQSDQKDKFSITEDHPRIASVDLYELIDSESNIREGPGTNYPIIRRSRKGEVGEHQSVEMGWMKLQFADGSMGWIHEQNVKSKN